jgi:hypothetical protein
VLFSAKANYSFYNIELCFCSRMQKSKIVKGNMKIICLEVASAVRRRAKFKEPLL